jgi:hypothetical protein
MRELNQRPIVDQPSLKRRAHLLLEFPELRLESVVIQWDFCAPTVLVQIKQDAREPVRFEGQRAPALDFPLHDFVDAAHGRVFGRPAHEADILFSARAFDLVQPEPDLFLPPQDLWEARLEAIRALGLADEPGLAPLAPLASQER